jgi:hypothetical protein
MIKWTIIKQQIVLFFFYFQIDFYTVIELISMASAPITERTTNMITSTEMITDSSEIETNNSTRKFNLKILRDAFMDCIQPDNTLLLGEYIRAYDELCV